MSTPFLDEVYNRVNFERYLVYKFFTVFSLFEYALKRAGFAYIRGVNGDVFPDWSSFSKSIEEDFVPNATPELAEAVNYMLEEPVMRQVLRDDSLSFMQRQRPGNIGDTEWFSFLIRGVRNNLFHGGKFRYHPERDNQLIQSSLIILEAWARCDQRVEQELENVR